MFAQPWLRVLMGYIRKPVILALQSTCPKESENKLEQPKYLWEGTGSPCLHGPVSVPPMWKVSLEVSLYGFITSLTVLFEGTKKYASYHPLLGKELPHSPLTLSENDCFSYCLLLNKKGIKINRHGLEKPHKN